MGEVQNQYQRRADLIPNLVETVKGYAKQEQDVLVAVTEARAKVGQMQLPPDILTNPDAFKQFEQNQAQLTGALSRLMVVVEKYPELKSNQNFLALQSQLEGTENRIAVARRDYIQAVQAYNTEIRTFPGRLWAMVLRLRAEAELHRQRRRRAGAQGQLLSPLPMPPMRRVLAVLPLLLGLLLAAAAVRGAELQSSGARRPGGRRCAPPERARRAGAGRRHSPPSSSRPTISSWS